MIKKKLYILLAVILLTLAGTYVFTYVSQNQVEKKVKERTLQAINETIGRGVVQRTNYMLEILSEEIAGKNLTQQKAIINRMMVPFKQFGFEGYTQCITLMDGTPVFLDSTENPGISNDIDNSRYREFITKFQKLKEKGGGFFLYSTDGSALPNRSLYVTAIPHTELWHGIDIELSAFVDSIKNMFIPLSQMNDIHKKMMHIITGIVFIFILFTSIHITRQITELEQERDTQHRKLQDANMLLEAEVNIRKQIENELKEANNELKLISSRDGLTGLANRRYYDEYIVTEWERMAREKKPLSIVLCDVDYFKKYNDAYGHLDGDACLRSIAEVIIEACKRPADLAARYGGEEFIIILPDTNAAGARFVAENIRSGVEKLSIPHSESEIGYISISLGVSTCLPVYGDEPGSLVLLADRALYMAKDTGRNRIMEL